MAVQPTKVELRYGILTTGTQFVMIPGVLLMPMLLADNLGTRRQHMLTREPTLAKGSGEILLDNLNCDGTERSLFQCAHNGLYSHNCWHGEDAGVTCK